MIRRLLSTASAESRDLSFADVWRRGLDSTDLSTPSGEEVNYTTALGLSSVYAAINLLSGTIASLGFDVFFKRGASELAFRPLPQFARQMSRFYTNVEIINQIVVSLLTDGNCYITTVRNSSGTIEFIDVLDPGTITPEMATDDLGNQRIIYKSSQAPEEIYTTRDITQFRLMQRPGQIEGVSPITSARDFIGLGLAQQTFAGSFFGNGSLPGAVVSVDGQLSETGAQQLKQAWASVHGGAKNSHRLAVLTEGAKFSRVSLSPADAAWIEGSQHTVKDIARLFGVPPFLLADSSGSTSWGSGLKEMNLAMQMYSLRPIVTRIEATLNQMLRSMGIEVAYFRFDLASMSRNHPDRWSDYSTAINSGVLSINEARSYERLGPIEDGDKHFMPLNLSPIDEPRP